MRTSVEAPSGTRRGHAPTVGPAGSLSGVTPRPCSYRYGPGGPVEHPEIPFTRPILVSALTYWWVERVGGLDLE